MSQILLRDKTNITGKCLKPNKNQATVLKIDWKFLPKTKKTRRFITAGEKAAYAQGSIVTVYVGIWETDSGRMKLETLLDWAHRSEISSEIGDVDPGDVEPCIDRYARKQSLTRTREGTSIQWILYDFVALTLCPREHPESWPSRSFGAPASSPLQ